MSGDATGTAVGVSLLVAVAATQLGWSAQGLSHLGQDS